MALCVTMKKSHSRPDGYDMRAVKMPEAGVKG